MTWFLFAESSVTESINPEIFTFQKIQTISLELFPMKISIKFIDIADYYQAK